QPANPAELAESALRQCMNLYSEKNKDQLTRPFVDMVYLFDKSGAFVSTSYIASPRNVQQTWDDEYTRLYHRFVAAGEDVQIIRARNHINVIYTVYNDSMLPQGTILFGINENALQELVQKLADYPDSCWLIFDKHGSRVLASRGNPMNASDIATLAVRSSTTGEVYRAGYKDYLVYTRHLRMGLGCIFAIPENHFVQLLFESVKYYMLALIGVILALGLILLLVSVRLTTPLAQMTQQLQQMADEKFDTKLPRYNTREYDTLSTTFNSMTDTINHLINDVYEEKLLVMDSEIKFLQSQMNPHFMYNVLNTIALKAKIDGNEDVYKMASSFAGLTQARLAHTGDALITLEQELQYVNFYLELQQFRFEEKLQYYITVQDDALLKATLPKLILQMAVENAVVHGIEPKFGPGHVYVEIARGEDGLVLMVEDDGMGFADADGPIVLPLPQEDARAGHNHIAINNAWQLIRHFYGERYGISIVSRKGVGTLVTISVPLDAPADKTQTDTAQEVRDV
ncbi:MAG: histidine kinase, partial [Ruthenibacterium sp.]